MNKKLLFLLPIMLLLLIGAVLGAPVTQSVGCTQTTTDATTDLVLLNSTAVTFFTAGTDTSFSGGVAGFNNITPTLDFNLTNLCDNITAINGTAIKLNWEHIVANSGNVSNSSNITQYIHVSNYTIEYTDGTFTLIDNASLYNNSGVQVCYNVSLNTSFNLVLNISKFSVPTTADYGDDIAITDLDFQLNGTNWTTNHIVFARTCTVRDSCQATQVIIFAGLGLIAIAAIILAAFFIISMISGGDMLAVGATTLVISIIGLGIVVIIGYFIISSVGNSVCLV